MTDLKSDLTFFQAGLEELERYLLSNELYWPCRARTSDLSQLTPGSLLLVRMRLTGWGATGLEALDSQFDAMRSKWRTAWEGKVSREVHARSERWHGSLSAHRKDPHGAARLYPQDVRQRAMLTLLGEQSDALDEYLKAVLLPGPFVWDTQLQSGFPQNDFWFLYGSLSTEGTR